MCKSIKHYPANTKSQAGKDETSHQDTKKCSPTINIQYNIKKIKYIHPKLSMRIKTFCSFQCKSTTTAGKDHRYVLNKSLPNYLHRIHMLQHNGGTSYNTEIPKFCAKQLQLISGKHNAIYIRTTTIRHSSQRATLSPMLQSRILVYKVLTSNSLSQNNRMAHK